MVENRGGRREGAGRPKNPASSFSDSFKRKAMKALKDQAKILGMSDPFEALATLALSNKVQDTVRLGAWKIYSEMNVIKESKQLIDIGKADKPTVYLPEKLSPPQEAKQKEREAAQFH